MPFYDFKCNKCDKIFEFFKKSMVDDFPERIQCENCGSSDVSRSYSSFTMQVSPEGIVKHKCTLTPKGKTVRVK